MSAEVIFWALIVAGFIPWWMSRQVIETRRRGRRKVSVTWRVRAIFWRLTVERQGRERRAWQVSIPLIRRLADAVWAAVRTLVK